MQLFSFIVKTWTAKHTARREKRPIKKVASVINPLLKSFESGAALYLYRQIAEVHYDPFLVWRKEEPSFGRQVNQAAEAAGWLLNRIERQGRQQLSPLRPGLAFEGIQSARGQTLAAEYAEPQHAPGHGRPGEAR